MRQQREARQGRVFFFEKKKQKTFIHLRRETSAKYFLIKIVFWGLRRDKESTDLVGQADLCHIIAMSGMTSDLTLERLARLTTAVADLMDGNNRQFRELAQWLKRIDDRLDRMDERLGRMETELRSVASEQLLLSNRVEEAFSRSMRTNMRLDRLTPETEPPP